MKIHNMTPHVVTFVIDGVKVDFPSEGVIRAAQKDEQVGEIETEINLGNSSAGVSIPVFTSSFGAPEGVTNFIDPDAVYIVSAIAAQSLKAAGYDMTKFLVPSGTIRDEQGRIVGCKGLARI